MIYIGILLNYSFIIISIADCFQSKITEYVATDLDITVIMCLNRNIFFRYFQFNQSGKHQFAQIIGTLQLFGLLI